MRRRRRTGLFGAAWIFGERWSGNSCVLVVYNRQRCAYRTAPSFLCDEPLAVRRAHRALYFGGGLTRTR
jgi:hypothetical protein